MIEILAAVVVAALIAYLVTGGADYGSGVWELLATGPRAAEQRAALRRSIAPIWEAHHVWLILVVVLLFVGFPAAFAILMVSLHIPLTLLLFGIVLRGSAFVFRDYSAGAETIERQWSHVFVIASAITPVALGTVAGAVAGGGIEVARGGGVPSGGFLSAWFSPFPLVVGLLTLAICSFLAATYMTTEVEEPALRGRLSPPGTRRGGRGRRARGDRLGGGAPRCTAPLRRAHRVSLGAPPFTC